VKEKERCILFVLRLSLQTVTHVMTFVTFIAGMRIHHVETVTSQLLTKEKANIGGVTVVHMKCLRVSMIRKTASVLSTGSICLHMRLIIDFGTELMAKS